jgi:undecaprenyl diphosphate synthase
MLNTIKNVAIIMDGNGRWASDRGKPRFYGHVRGASNVKSIVQVAIDEQIESLSLFAFSTENHLRPSQEVNILFKLLKRFILSEFNNIHKNNICFNIIGSLTSLDSETNKLVKQLIDLTKLNTGLRLIFAFDYGGKAEILRAASNILVDRMSIRNDKPITESEFEKYLYDPFVPQIDLMIRTGGDMRVSNFLLWQLAYAELFFTSVKWPDINRDHLIDILTQVRGRLRKFGKIAQINDENETR